MNSEYLNYLATQACSLPRTWWASVINAVCMVALFVISFQIMLCPLSLFLFRNVASYTGTGMCSAVIIRGLQCGSSPHGFYCNEGLYYYYYYYYYYPKLIMEWVPLERRKRGRPRKTWMEGVQAAMTTRNLETDHWRNREEWRLVSGRRRQLL